MSLTQFRLNNITSCLGITANTLTALLHGLKLPLMEALVNTTQSLLQLVQNIKQDKADCAELLEQVYQLLNAIIIGYVESDTGVELPPGTLDQIGKFTEYF
ncbi:hypothetical protein C8R46DRAFT_1208162 [Mycena filopes]|nr:hypothetical protein C8R46DRAFT_1208162 [Mycena filopes]